MHLQRLGHLITHGVDGFMEPVGDIDAQAERLTQLLTDDAFHAQISAAARKTAETRFCTDLIIPRYERYYQQICRAEGTLSSSTVSN